MLCLQRSYFWTIVQKKQKAKTSLKFTKIKLMKMTLMKMRAKMKHSRLRNRRKRNYLSIHMNTNIKRIKPQSLAWQIRSLQSTSKLTWWQWKRQTFKRLNRGLKHTKNKIISIKNQRIKHSLKEMKKKFFRSQILIILQQTEILKIKTTMV